MNEDTLSKVKDAMDIGATGVSILITLAAMIYKVLQDKGGLSPDEIHRRVTAENDATAKALSDAEAREQGIYDATHPK